MLRQTPGWDFRARHYLQTTRDFLHPFYPPTTPRPQQQHEPLLKLPLQPAAYQALLHLSKKTQSLILGKLLHSLMIRTSYRPGQFIHNNLLTMYCKCGDMATARLLFDGMPKRDIVTWNSLMAGYSQIGFAHKALNVFVEARNTEGRLDRFSYAGALSACAETADLRKGRIIHGLVVADGLARQAFLTNSLIDMYSKCGRIEDVRLVFDRAEELDDVSWNSLLSAYVQIGWPEVAMNILVWMHRFGVKLNSFALGSVLKACSGFYDVEVRRMLHACVAKVGLDFDLFVGSAMLDMYAKNGGLDEAIKVFEHIPNPSVVVFNAMIAGFSRLGTETCAEVRIEALRLYSVMLRRGMRPSKFTYKSVLEACNLIRAFKSGKQIHAQVITNNLRDDEFIANALIKLYSTSGLIEDSIRCFQTTKKQGISIWSSLISGCVQNEHFDRALSMVIELLGLGIKPDVFAISNVMSACANLGIMRTGEQIHGLAMKAGLDRFTVCGNTQIDMYAKLGDLDAAIRTFEDIGTLDVVSWSAMISSHALHGCGRDALTFFEKMKECRVAPNHITFLAILTACSHEGLVDEGFRYFDSMRIDYGIAPTVKHFACIVDILGRAGRLADAEDFILNSGFDHDPVIWRCLLQSCQFHGDTRRGIHAGERLMELEPSAATSYMLLYNMYLDAGNISMAMRTRGLMRERGVNKETSVSWIEIGASVHSFGAGDHSHPQSRAIYAKLEEMLLKIKQMGYAGVKILELEHRSAKWKESLMDSHDEKLAVAIGMIGLPEMVAVRVTKNLRVCADCHTTLKLFSESERREIILRDATRIHRFRFGSCSCGDYW